MCLIIIIVSLVINLLDVFFSYYVMPLGSGSKCSTGSQAPSGRKSDDGLRGPRLPTRGMSRYAACTWNVLLYIDMCPILGSCEGHNRDLGDIRRGVFVCWNRIDERVAMALHKQVPQRGGARDGIILLFLLFLLPITVIVIVIIIIMIIC